MQLDIMLFFQRIRTPLVEKLAEIISAFGEIAVPLVIIMLFLWCFNRKKAFAVSFSLLSSLLATQTLKAIFRLPRPFQVYPDLIDGGRLSTATGYSFPSGHSTTSGSLYSSLIVIAWKKAVTIICVLLIILVPVSRMVLGVHWPLDVATGTLIGLLGGFLLSPLALRLFDSRRAFLIVTFCYGIAASAAALVLAVILGTADVDKVAFSDLMSNAAITGSVMMGFYLERKLVESAPEKNSTGRKILVFILGLISTAIAALIIAIIPAPEAFTSFMLYYMLGLWCVFIYPMIAVKTGLMPR